MKELTVISTSFQHNSPRTHTAAKVTEVNECKHEGWEDKPVIPPVFCLRESSRKEAQNDRCDGADQGDDVCGNKLRLEICIA